MQDLHPVYIHHMYECIPGKSIALALQMQMKYALQALPHQGERQLSTLLALGNYRLQAKGTLHWHGNQICFHLSQDSEGLLYRKLQREDKMLLIDTVWEPMPIQM